MVSLQKSILRFLDRWMKDIMLTETEKLESDNKIKIRIADVSDYIQVRDFLLFTN